MFNPLTVVCHSPLLGVTDTAGVFVLGHETALTCEGFLGAIPRRGTAGQLHGAGPSPRKLPAITFLAVYEDSATNAVK